MSYTLAVMHVPERPERVALLARQREVLGGLETIRRRTASYVIVTDTLQGGPRSRNVWAVARRAYLAAHWSADHLIVLQDDALPAAGFFDAVDQITAALPDRIVGLLSPRAIQRRAVDRGDCYFTGATGAWGVGLLFPKSLAQQIVAWSDTHVDPDYRWDDGRVNMWALEHAVRLWFTAPSLVEHEGAAQSLVGNHGGGAFSRRAALFLPGLSGCDFSRVPDRPLYDGALGAYRQRARFLHAEVR